MAKSLMHWLKNPITPLKKDVKLLKITEVDGFYRSNPFILSGYRQAKFLNSGRHLVLLQALGSKFYHYTITSKGKLNGCNNGRKLACRVSMYF